MSCGCVGEAANRGVMYGNDTGDDGEDWSGFGAGYELFGARGN
jgi:hypothetical protein